MNLSIIKNKSMKVATWYVFGNFFDKAISLLTIPIFTRLLSTYDYGVVNTYLSWVIISSVIIGMSLGTSVRNAIIDYSDDVDGYISSIFFFSLISFATFCVVSTVISLLFFKSIPIILILLCLFQGYMTFVSDTISIKYMMKNQYKKRTFLVTIPHILISVLSVIGIVILKDYKYMGRIIPYVLVTAIVSSMFLISTFIKGKKMINIEYWKYGLTLSIPLVLHGVSMTILAHSDKIMITKIVGADQTGIYSLIYNLSMLVTVFSASLDGVWIPWFTRSMQSNNVITINKNVKRYIEIMIIVVCGLLLVSPEIIKILADKAYWVGMKMIPPIILASFIMYLYTIEVHIEYYYKATKSIAFNTCTAAGVNLLLNIIFIPTFGAIAAAYTTLFAYFVSFIMHYKKARKLDNRIISFNNYIVPILVASLAAVLMYVLLDYFLVRWILTIVAFLIYIMFAYKSKRYEKFLN